MQPDDSGRQAAAHLQDCAGRRGRGNGLCLHQRHPDAEETLSDTDPEVCGQAHRPALSAGGTLSRKGGIAMYADIDSRRKVSLMEMTGSEVVSLHKALLHIIVNHPLVAESLHLQEIRSHLQEVILKLNAHDF